MAKETRLAYGERLAELIVENPDIVVIDADLSGSTRTSLAKKACPERHFNAGIAEANLMGMAAGMAASGKTVFASTFAIFAAGRAFEIIRNSICYPKLNVKVCATHAGLTVGEDGASHQAIEDLALMRSIPNMQVFCPSDQYMTKAVIDYVAKVQGPCYVRLGRGKVDDVYNEAFNGDVRKLNVIKRGKDICLLATGLMVQEALKAAEMLKQQNVEVTVAEAACLKPIDEAGILELLKTHQKVYTLEEHSIIGGLYGAVAEIKAKTTITTPILPIGIEDDFGQSGKMMEVLAAYDLTAEKFVEKIK